MSGSVLSLRIPVDLGGAFQDLIQQALLQLGDDRLNTDRSQINEVPGRNPSYSDGQRALDRVYEEPMRITLLNSRRPEYLLGLCDDLSIESKGGRRSSRRKRCGSSDPSGSGSDGNASD